MGHVPARRRGGESGNDRPGAGLDRDWTILFSKGSELLRAKRRLRREQLALAEARSLDEASELAQNFGPESVSAVLLNDAQNELELSAESNDNNGIKERTGFRLERRVAAYSRNMGRGNGFGYHRRHLAVRRPVRHRVGHHEQLHRHRPFADHQPGGRGAGHRRGAAGDRAGPGRGDPCRRYLQYLRPRHQAIAPVGDVAAQVLLLQGRDLDLAATAEAKRSQHAHQLRAG